VDGFALLDGGIRDPVQRKRAVSRRV
jgi:hypothetical protein